MTAQMGESLRYEGKEYSMCNEPLEDYFERAGVRPEFGMFNTSCWRGYSGSWIVIENELFLVELSGTLEDGTEVTLEKIFPDYDGAIFADWFSGVLRIPDGKLLNYVHAGFASEYERDLLITVNKGVVVETSVKDNGKSRSMNTAKGFVIAAMSILSRRKKQSE